MSTVPEDDAELLNRYVDARSEAAFTELVRRHVDLVYATALRRIGGDRQLAEDLTQGVFRDFARKAVTLRGRASLAGWLYRSTRFATAQAVRAERRRKTHELEAHRMNELNAADPADWERLRPVIDDALDDLDEGEREVVLLRFFEGRPFAEVGARFAVSPEAARMRVDRALDKLRTLLTRRGIDSTAAALTVAFSKASATAAPPALSATVVAGVFAPVGTAAIATATAWKIAAGCAVAALGVGVIANQVRSARPTTASPTGGLAQVEVAGARMNPAAASVVVARAAPVASPVAVPNPGGSGANIDSRIERLDRLVHLTAAQKAQAAAVFRAENDALQAFTSPDDRMIKGVPIRQKSRAQIRALLTPAQQDIYARTPQRLGGAAMQDGANLAERVDKVVTLTEDQTLQVAAIFQRETDTLRALPPTEQLNRRASLRQASKAEIRALLTPEQQQKFDANPNGAEDLAERAFVTAFVKSSPAIVAHFGPATIMTLKDSSVTSTDVNGAAPSMKGYFAFEIQGTAAAGNIKVYWEKQAPTAPVKIVRIEGPDGIAIQPLRLPSAQPRGIR